MDLALGENNIRGCFHHMDRQISMADLMPQSRETVSVPFALIAIPLGGELPL